MTRTPDVDPITTQVLGNALVSIAEEMSLVLRRASYSSNIKERADCSTALFDASGSLVAQAENMPIHMGSMTGLVRAILASPGAEALRPGDVYISNDPYLAGSTHLPDITMACPVFADGVLVGISANIAHHSDIGGTVPGSNAGDLTSIYQEGLRIPIVRFAVAGEVSPDVLGFVMLNSRVPEERRGDLLAQLASVTTGAERLVDLHGRYGTAEVLSASDYLLVHAGRRLGAAVAACPDGVYEFEDSMDPDGEDAEPITLRVAVTIEGESIGLDFAGTGAQSPLGINVVRSALEATVYYVVKAVLDPDIPPNGGFFDAIEIDAPPGSILDPREPAPVTARTDTCQRVADVVLGALAKAVPERVPAGCHSTVTYVGFAGDTDDGYFVYPEVVAGGFGARPDRDGLDAVQVHICNSSNLPIEALELEYPLRVERYELIEDSGGSGEWRGGLGIRRDIRVLAGEATFSAHADRQVFAPWGLAGGHDGAKGRFVLRPGTPDEHVLPGGRVSGIVLRHDDVVRVETPGSGGYGPPERRAPTRVEADVREGRVSRATARAHYGVDVEEGER